MRPFPRRSVGPRNEYGADSADSPPSVHYRYRKINLPCTKRNATRKDYQWLRDDAYVSRSCSVGLSHSHTGGLFANPMAPRHIVTHVPPIRPRIRRSLLSDSALVSSYPSQRYRGSTWIYRTPFTTALGSQSLYATSCRYYSSLMKRTLTSRGLIGTEKLGGGRDSASAEYIRI